MSNTLNVKTVRFFLSFFLLICELRSETIAHSLIGQASFLFTGAEEGMQKSAIIVIIGGIICSLGKAIYFESVVRTFDRLNLNPALDSSLQPDCIQKNVYRKMIKHVLHSFPHCYVGKWNKENTKHEFSCLFSFLFCGFSIVQLYFYISFLSFFCSFASVIVNDYQSEVCLKFTFYFL